MCCLCCPSGLHQYCVFSFVGVGLRAETKKLNFINKYWNKVPPPDLHKKDATVNSYVKKNSLLRWAVIVQLKYSDLAIKTCFFKSALINCTYLQKCFAFKNFDTRFFFTAKSSLFTKSELHFLTVTAKS